MQKIAPFLWFNDNAEEAFNFYTTVFKNSKVKMVSRYPEGGPAPAGSFMTGSFEIDGQEFMILNGGPHKVEFTMAISFFVHCKTQEEIDHLWENLSAAGGEQSQCGWVKDKFGVWWQIVPDTLMLMYDKDKKKATAVMQAMMKMSKLIIKDLQDAYDNA